MVRKNTSWDMIPKDWDVVVLGEYSEISRGGSPRPIQDYLTSSCHGINWIKIGDVSKNSKYIFSTAEKIIPEGMSKSRPVFSGDLILSNSMSFGRPYILKIDGCIHDGWLVIQNYQSAFDKEYLYYCLGSELIIQQYISMAAGSSVQNLNKDKVSAVMIAKPPIKEQIAIAETLADVDSLISSLQKLIEKKKAIKQGAMQELLTGKKRLPGFSEEWAYRRVGEICSITKGQIITEKTAIHGNVPVIAGGKTPAFYHNVANREPDVITISASGANAGYIAYHDYPIFASDCSTIESSDQYDVKFIYYALLYHQQELIGMQTGGAQPHIHPKEIGVLLVPRINQEEQRAIANVLFDMDSEIEQLEKKLAKYQQIKQGMMQELLTGRIRLV